MDSPAQSSFAGQIRILLFLALKVVQTSLLVGSPVQCSSADSDGRCIKGYMEAVQGKKVRVRPQYLSSYCSEEKKNISCLKRIDMY